MIAIEPPQSHAKFLNTLYSKSATLSPYYAYRMKMKLDTESLAEYKAASHTSWLMSQNLSQLEMLTATKID